MTMKGEVQSGVYRPQARLRLELVCVSEGRATYSVPSADDDDVDDDDGWNIFCHLCVAASGTGNLFGGYLGAPLNSQGPPDEWDYCREKQKSPAWVGPKVSPSPSIGHPWSALLGL